MCCQVLTKQPAKRRSRQLIRRDEQLLTSMKNSFKIFLLLSALAGLIPGSSWAQENAVSKVHLIARAEEKAIVLRIAPGSPSLWEVGNKHGYIIERFTVTRGNQYLGNREREVL